MFEKNYDASKNDLNREEKGESVRTITHGGKHSLSLSHTHTHTHTHTRACTHTWTHTHKHTHRNTFWVTYRHTDTRTHIHIISVSRMAVCDTRFTHMSLRT